MNNYTRFITGECSAVMAGMESESVDMVLTSPPYDKLRTYNGFTFDFESIAAQLYRVLKLGGVIVWIVGDATVNGSESGTSFRQALFFMSLGLSLHDTMIYRKSSFTHPEACRYYSEFEYMFVLSKGKPRTTNLICDRPNVTAHTTIHGTERVANGVLTKQHGAIMGKKTRPYGIRGNVWTYNTGAGNSTLDKIAFQHPATFPEALARDHIMSWSNPGDLILDPFIGSGTTAKMAYLQERNCIGIDINPEYIGICERRLAGVQAQLRLPPDVDADPAEIRTPVLFTA